MFIQCEILPKCAGVYHWKYLSCKAAISQERLCSGEWWGYNIPCTEVGNCAFRSCVHTCIASKLFSLRHTCKHRQSCLSKKQLMHSKISPKSYWGTWYSYCATRYNHFEFERSQFKNIFGSYASEKISWNFFRNILIHTKFLTWIYILFFHGTDLKTSSTNYFHIAVGGRDERPQIQSEKVHESLTFSVRKLQ